MKKTTKKRKPSVTSSNYWFFDPKHGFTKDAPKDSDLDWMVNMLEDMKARIHGKRR